MKRLSDTSKQYSLVDAVFFRHLFMRDADFASHLISWLSKSEHVMGGAIADISQAEITVSF